ncbi:MAG: peptidoglycan-binding domain-containing protein [Alphaproteobacteria bacterium]
MPRPATGDSLIVAVAYSSTVYQLQVGLNAQGYDAGPSDGLMGSRTRTAIESYQRNNGLLVTGQPSQGLLSHVQANQQARTTTPTASPGELNERQISRLQRRLDRLGYDTAVSGQVDSETQAAIRAYERDNNLLVTGVATEALAEHVHQSVLAKRAERRDDRRDEADEIDTDTIAAIQRGLRARGYTVTAVDGELDWSTREAIKAYQRDRGAAITGEASLALAEQLGEGLAAAADTPENIRAVQQALNERGYSAGPADGVMGPSTRTAIQQYRRRTGISAGSSVDQALLTSLGIAEADAGTSVAADAAADDNDSMPVLLSDRFADGDYTVNPRWQVLSKSFTVANGELRSSVPTQQAKSADNDDLGKAVVRGVLSQVLGVPSQPQSEAAVIAHSSGFGGTFELQMRVRHTGKGPSKIHFGPYQGTNAVAGYRLVYDSDKSQPLSLVNVEESGASVLASTSQVPALGDGNWHDVRLRRDEDGRLSVDIDGTEVLNARYTTVANGHGGISFANFGGDWAVSAVELKAPRAG